MTKQATKEKELTVIENKQLVAGVNLDDLAKDAGAGSQNVTANDTATPLLTILQSNSPQCKKSDGKYIAGATEGCIFNNVTGEVYDGEVGFVVVPCYFEKVYIEWRANRGGFVAIHGADTPLKNQVSMVKNAEGKDVPTLPNGNMLAETNQHYILMLRSEGYPEPAVIPMVSSNMRTSRMWNTLIKKVMLQKSDGTPFNPASYWGQYKLTTKVKQKDANSWYIWNVEPMGAVPTKAIYDMAKTLEKSVAVGSVNVKHDVNEAEAMGVTAEDTDKM
jgi:hypothetical protein